MWFLGVGFSLSFVSGQVRRAPAWMIEMGLEWVHRLIQDPRRLAGRYLVHDLPFAARLFGHAIKNRLLRRDVVAQAPPDPGGPDAAIERVVFAYGSLERGRAELLAELLAEDDFPPVDIYPTGWVVAGYSMPNRSSSASSPRHPFRTRTLRSRCTRAPSSASIS
jgi:hypothetical protein